MAKQFEIRGSHTLNDADAKELAEKARYDATVSCVQHLFRVWQAWKQVREPGVGQTTDKSQVLPINPSYPQSKPFPIVEHKSGLEALLVVTNRGAAGRFSAHVRFEEPEAVPYVVPWLESNEASILIEEDGSRTLNLAAHYYEGWRPPSPGDEQLRWIRFWQFTADGLRHFDKGH